MAKKRVPGNGDGITISVPVDGGAASRTKALVFISHDSRDAEVAEAFGNLLTDASGGVLKSFRSSDKKGTSGIEFGAEWYRAIMENIKEATDVVALLTPNSIDRPWILYEAGVAKGKLDSLVFGLAVGVPLEKASVGPFAQFQNCGDDEDSLTKLVLQLIRRNPEAAPREEAVRRQVQAFRSNLGTLIKERAKASPPKMDETSVAKLFEEVKVMFRELPEQLETTVRESVVRGGGRRKRPLHPAMIEDLFMHPEMRKSPGGEAFSWLMLATMIRDEVPWIAELAMEMHRALRDGDQKQVETAQHALLSALEVSRRNPMLEDLLLRGSDERDTYMFLRHLPEILSRNLAERPPSNARKGTLRRRSESTE